MLDNPANRHRAVPFTLEQFHYAFTNTLSEEESAEVYERYHVAAPGAWVWGGVLANFTPGHQETWVNFANDERAPLLFIAGGADHIMPAVGQQVQRGALREVARASPTTGSSRAASTSRSASPAGRRSPTTRSTGPTSTPEGASSRARRRWGRLQASPP